MPAPLKSHLASMVLVTLLSMALRADAGKVVCPVCGESYSDDVEECPNDGTNLKLVGKSADDEESPSDEPKETGDTKPGRGEEGESPDSEPVSEPGAKEGEVPPERAAAPIRYKRHDRGGKRKPASSKDASGYSDRMSRIPGGGRVGVPGKRAGAGRKSQPSESDAAGQKTRSQFESRRHDKWLRRPETQLDTSKDSSGKAAARKRLLDHLAAPLASLGLRIFWMGEGDHPGPVGAAEIALNLARYRLRAGLASTVGIRALESRNELVFLQSATVGFQWPRRFTPFFLVRGGIGLIATERFNQSLVYMMTSLGAEVGIDAWVTPWIAISPSLGYMRCTVNNAYWHSLTVKVAVGF